MIWLPDNCGNNQANSELSKSNNKPKRLTSRLVLDGIKHFLISYWVTCLCIFGCFVQIFFLTRNYFSKNVNYQVISLNSENITVPEVIICTPIHTVLDYGKLVTERASLFNNSCLNSSSVDKCVLRKFKIPSLDFIIRQNFDITSIYPFLIKSNQLIVNVYIHGFPDVLANGVCKTKDLISYPNVCYKITCSEEPANKINVRRFVPSFIPLYESLISFNLNNSVLASRTKAITIYLQSMDYPRRETEFDFGQSFSYDVDDPLIVQFKFSIQRMFSLPSPYPTNCRKHDHDLLMSYCLNNASILLLNSSFPRRWIDLEDFKGYHFGLIPDMSDNNWDQLGLIKDDCRRRYPNPNCESELLTLQKMGLEASELPAFTKMIVIAIHAPDEPDLHFFVTPAMTASECIIMIFSILGFWFGFDVYHNSNRISALLIRSVGRSTETKVAKACNPNYRAIKPKLRQTIKLYQLQRREKLFTVKSNP
uniref:Uncharacterized protein n=1 Tax=Tetranychus urticae TaxID=32264 RepID=T1KNN8_TETUR